ncbi:phage holin family protein [Gilliamella sp. B3791]|uniref:phage holin family protein n=2 Tax=unclassified Gilliamella TaxID=2685620 RepID=UPI00226ACDCA|nr:MULTISPECIES: phage holin family protein [unclassified Gilliamella]MCX8641508.1 phage holin family protein [Gilliamella sp. B3835]MCX8750181.1 phage holin family protein [Gilliamella sp. B3464]MCX8706723.1 phage holin family protein [Gilliamella sp. B3783]MCX8715673.1 phage holin family protein [Gilliamella sp. B3784]MCX8718480.1 phage holin family protein [Gilliamella sp. B3788]
MMSHMWTFQRVGGLDQVVFKSADDIIDLPQLDPKLWVALSCPTTGLDFDERTLALLDDDKDGRIRIPDILNAINWIKDKLVSFDNILTSRPTLPLSEINTSTEQGKKLLITARSILANLGKNQAESLTQDDVQQSFKINASKLYNGDLIFPASAQLPTQMQSFIEFAIKTVGAEKDMSGQDGITLDIAKAFASNIKIWQQWQTDISNTQTPFGANSAEIWKLIQLLKPKIDDYFLRVELAQYAPQAQSSLNVDEKYIVPNQNGLLSNEALAQLPLSKIDNSLTLDLVNGLNPLWKDKISRFKTLVATSLTNPNQLSQSEWKAIQHSLEGYATLINSKPEMVKLNVTTNPTESIEDIPNQLFNGTTIDDLLLEFEKMIEQDSKTPISASDVLVLEKLVLFQKHLYRLLVNFASFADFFSLEKRAAFQLGKLYIDGRCATLCVAVENIAKHSTMANYSELCLLYCECTRLGEKQTIAAAITAGQGDLLIEGRNGVFIDNDGNDWDANVVKMITKPISIQQAIWAPYQRIGRLITEQINKWATSKDADIEKSSEKVIQQPETKFDIGKSVGIFAAIGLAVGAIGTALATLFQAIFSLTWWQFPLVFIGLFLIISGPSVVLAWLKLRRRTLGPLLEASGWAINGQVKINLLLGRLLTSKAELPENAKRNLRDPLKRRNKKLTIAFWLAIVIGIAISGGWLWYKGYFNQYLEPEKSSVQKNTTTTSEK